MPDPTLRQAGAAPAGTLDLPSVGRATGSVVALAILEPSISWNYTTALNLLFLALAALLLWRFFRTGGRQMLAMMNDSPETLGKITHTTDTRTDCRIPRA